jgi:hypothetical protein
MNNHLPAGLQQLVQGKVQSNWFKFSDRAITAAAPLLREDEEARAPEGIRHRLVSSCA